MENVMLNIMSKEWHDLDGKYGVEVEGGGKRWVAYGDGELFTEKNKENLERMVEVGRKSIEQVEGGIREGRGLEVPRGEEEMEVEKRVPRAVAGNEVERWGGEEGKKGGKWWEAMKKLPRLMYGVYKEHGELVVREGPAAVMGKVNGDEWIREWVKRYGEKEIGSVPWKEKVRMISRLLWGWVSEEDVEAVEKICGSVKSKEEMEWIRSKVGKEVKGLYFEKVKKRVEGALEREPKGGER